MSRHRAITALPNVHRQRATLLLRSQLHEQITDFRDSEIPDWSTLYVSEPVEVFDSQGRIRFEYRASVESRPISELLERTPVLA